MASPFTFYRPTPYAPETKQQIWSTILTDSHDLFCGCTEPISHMLHELIPPDSKYRHWTIDQFINNNFKRQQCLFGGVDEKGGGEAAADPTTGENTTPKEEGGEDLFTEENLKELIDAADAAQR